MELFAKTVELFLGKLILDTWQVSEYTFGNKHTFLLIFYHRSWFRGVDSGVFFLFVFSFEKG